VPGAKAPMVKRDDVLSLPRRALAELLAGGHAIDPAALDDTEYRGISLGLPRFVERLTWKTFQKVFHRDPITSRLRGWNVRIEQRGLDAASVPFVRRGAPRTFGHYEVVPYDGRRLPRAIRRGIPGLLIDYGRGGNGRFDPMRFMVDPLVALNAGSAELLLGWSYVDLGFLRFGTPSYFLLERERPLTHTAAAPRSVHPG